MKIHSYEKGFLAAGVIVLVACAAALVYASVALGIHLPGDHGRVDPAQVANMAPFNQPGLRQLGANRYQATIMQIARECYRTGDIIEVVVYVSGRIVGGPRATTGTGSVHDHLDRR